MLLAAHAELSDSIAVAQADQFDLLHHHQKSVDDGVLCCQNLALLMPVSLYHLSTEWIVTDGYNLVSALGTESKGWIHIFEAIKQVSVCLEDDDFVVHVSWHGHTNITNVCAFVEKQAVSTQVSKQLIIQLVVLKWNSFGYLTEGFLIFWPDEVWVESLLMLQLYLTTTSLFDFLRCKD